MGLLTQDDTVWAQKHTHTRNPSPDQAIVRLRGTETKTQQDHACHAPQPMVSDTTNQLRARVLYWRGVEVIIEL